MVPRDLVFGEGTGGFSGFSACKARLDAKVGIGSWRLHDLRRTLATLAGEELGIQPHVVEAVLNHISGHKAGVAGIYNRAVYLREKTEALTLWAQRLAAAVAGTDSNVV